MDREEIKKIVTEVVDLNNNKGQFSVEQVKLHKHTGSDSSRVSFYDLVNKYILLPITIQGVQAQTSTNYSVFFTAPTRMVISGITEVHAVACTTGGAVTLQIEKLIGTTAPGSGTAFLITPFDLKGTLNTVQTGLLTSNTGILQINAGDRLALLVSSATLTSLSNVTVTLQIGIV